MSSAEDFPAHLGPSPPLPPWPQDKEPAPSILFRLMFLSTNYVSHQTVGFIKPGAGVPCSQFYCNSWTWAGKVRERYTHSLGLKDSRLVPVTQRTQNEGHIVYIWLQLRLGLVYINRKEEGEKVGIREGERWWKQKLGCIRLSTGLVTRWPKVDQIWVCFQPFWYMPRRWITGSCSNSVLNFLRQCQTVLHSSCPTLHSHWHPTRPNFLPLALSMSCDFGKVMSFLWVSVTPSLKKRG